MTTNRHRPSIWRRFSETPAYPLSAVVLALLFWQFVLAQGLISVIPTKYLGSPSGYASAFLTMAREGYAGNSLISHIGASFSRTLIGFSLAVAVAVPLGLLMGYYRLIGNLLIPIFAFLRPIPALAFIPVVTIWLGIGEPAKIALIAVTAFMFAVLGASLGVQAVPADYLRVARNYRLSGYRTLVSVILPPALPQIMAGLRTGMALSWAVVVAAELIAAQQGLGFIIMDASTFFQINTVYVGISIIGLIGILIDYGFTRLERRLLHWLGK